MCHHPFSPSVVTMSSSNSIGTWRMNKWYTELTDKEDDPHSSFSIRVSDTIVETNRSSYQIQEPIANDEERPAMKKNDYASSASTSSSVSTSSSCYDANEHNMWNPLLELFCHIQIGLCMETLVDEVCTAKVALSCHFAEAATVEALHL